MVRISNIAYNTPSVGQMQHAISTVKMAVSKSIYSYEGSKEASPLAISNAIHLSRFDVIPNLNQQGKCCLIVDL